MAAKRSTKPPLRRTVDLERRDDGKWHATLAIYGAERRTNLHGYGANIPAALVALSRSIERWAAEQMETLLGPPPAAEQPKVEPMPAPPLSTGPAPCSVCGAPSEGARVCPDCDRELGVGA